MYNLQFKGVSVMKKTREASNSQIGLAEKQNLVACIANMGATHVEITMFTADNAQLVAEGFTPSPLTIEAETQQWYDVIHAQPNVYGSSVNGGYMKVFDRAVFPQMGDNQGEIVGFPIETSTPLGNDTSAATDGDSTWCGRYYNYLYNHVTLAKIETGDIQCPFAEITGMAFSGQFFTTQAGAHALVADCHQISDAFATTAGKSVVFLNNPNYSEMNSGWWTAYTDTGINCFDYYGALTTGGAYATPEMYTSDYNNTYAGINVNGGGNPAAGYPLFEGEWGDLSGSIKLRKGTRSGDNFVAGTTCVEDWMVYWIAFLKAHKALVDAGKMIGFNYWGGWESQNTSILYKTGTGASSQYFPNWRGQMLANFFKGNGMTDRLPVNTAGTFADSYGGRNMHF